MMLDCYVRLVAITPSNSFARPVQSNLYLGIRRSHIQEPRLVLVTRSSATEFKVINNIKRIYQKELKDGKIGVELRTPPYQLLINANREELCKFIDFLLKLSSKKIVEDMDYIPVIPSLSKMKLTTNNKGSNPSKNYFSKNVLDPTTVPLHKNPLSNLHSHLKVINLPKSNITSIPIKLGLINIQTVNLEGNSLSDDNLLWLDELPIRKSLESLNLGENKIKCFPSVLVDFSSLFSLNLRDNDINYIPGGIENLRTLRFLNLSGNNISFLPASITQLRLEELDLTYNCFTNDKINNVNIEIGSNIKTFLRLQDLCAMSLKTSERRQLTYRDCPRRLLDRIRNLSVCVCGSLSIPYLPAQVLKPLTGIRFALTYKVHPQKGDFNQIPVHSIVMRRGNTFSNILLQYHFCKFVDKCEKIKKAGSGSHSNR